MHAFRKKRKTYWTFLLHICLPSLEDRFKGLDFDNKANEVLSSQLSINRLTVP